MFVNLPCPKFPRKGNFLYNPPNHLNFDLKFKAQIIKISLNQQRKRCLHDTSEKANS